MLYNQNYPYHIARCVGQQGVCCSAGDQADNEKYATGREEGGERRSIHLRKTLKIGTWNVRKLKERGKLNTVCNEMDRYDLQFLGIAETNWNGQGSFKTCTNHTVLFSGSEEGYSHGVVVILTRESSNALIGYSPISDRIIKVRIQAKPHNITFIQCYAPTSLASDEEIDSFYNSLQETMDSIPNRDIKVVMGDFNAKVGQGSTNMACGKFGLGEQNIRGEDLLEFCSSNNLTIANTLFQKHPRHHYTWISPDNRTRNQIDYITFSQKWKSNLKDVRTRPGADCNSDHQLLIVEIRFRLKKMEHPLPPLD